MVTNFCLGLTCLLIPVAIELFNLQAGLQLTNAGHAAAEVFILCGIYWLLMQILRLDAYLYLRNLLPREPAPKAAVQKMGAETNIDPAPLVKTPKNEPYREPALHGIQLLFRTRIKDHRTIKSI